jgi:hypothetical protein
VLSPPAMAILTVTVLFRNGQKRKKKINKTRILLHTQKKVGGPTHRFPISATPACVTQIFSRTLKLATVG